MPSFRYEALAPDGRHIRGQSEAGSADGLRAQLRAEGLLPLALHEALPGARGQAPRLDASRRTVLLQRLATLIGAGLPITDALATIGRQSAHTAERRCVQALAAAVAEGSGLGAAMAHLPGCFPEVVSAAVRAGEGGGQLTEVLERLAATGQRGLALERRLLAALAYPAVLLLVALGVCLLMVLWVVPQLAEAYALAGVPLPLTTRVIAGLADWVSAHAAWLAVAGALVLAGAGHALRDAHWRLGLAALSLRLPVVGVVLRTRAAVRLCSCLSLMLAGGVPMVDALRIAADLLGAPALRAQLLGVRMAVVGGSSLAQALEPTRLLPPIALDLVTTGEAGGRLPMLLERAATALEEELRAQVEVSLALLEPLLVVAVGLVVLVVVWSVMGPLAGLYGLAG